MKSVIKRLYTLQKGIEIVRFSKTTYTRGICGIKKAAKEMFYDG